MNRKYRKTVIAGNWKMNMLASEIKPFMEQLKENLPKTRACDVVLCTPAPLLPAMIKAGKDCKVAAGGQDVSKYEKGAYTGEVSAAQLADIGAKYCIVGHSERRTMFGETNEIVNHKVRALIDGGIAPIICVGESLAVRDDGTAEEFVCAQVRAALAGIEADEAKDVVIAYEPIWAIGTGRTATPEQAQAVCAAIRATLAELFGAELADSLRILYGGSMNVGNVESLLAQPDIDGGLVGGASLKAASFIDLVKACL